MQENIRSNYWFTTTLQISPWGQSCLLWNVSNKSSNCPSYGVGWERAFCCVIPRPLTALMFADRKIKRRAVIFVDNLHFVVYITEMTWNQSISNIIRWFAGLLGQSFRRLMVQYFNNFWKIPLTIIFIIFIILSFFIT